MPIQREIIELRDHSLSLFDASHDYYIHTRRAWRLVQQMVREGHQFTIRNQATGSTVNETELSGLAQDYVTGYLRSATFQQFVSVFEQFVLDLVRIWLTEHPNSLSENQLKFQTVLEAKDKAGVVNAVVQKKVVDLGYQRIADWFAYLEKIARLGCPDRDQIERLAEIKASRDILVHHNGIANSIYIEKSMGRARFADGDRLELPEKYH